MGSFALAFALVFCACSTGPLGRAQKAQPPADDVWVPYTEQELAWRPVGSPVAMESLGGSVQAYARYVQRDWSEVELRLGDRVLYRSREVDYESHHIIPYRRGEALLVQRVQGPPGTCVWGRSAIIFTVSPGSGMATPQHEVSLGDYLYGPPCPSIACGCGEWEATWTVAQRRGATVLETHPVAMGRGEWNDLEGLDVPMPDRVRLR